MSRTSTPGVLVPLALAGALALPAAPARAHTATAPIEGPAPREPQRLRAFIEMAALLGIGSTWYALDKDLNAVDWDYPDPWDRLSTDALRFDNNTFRMNNVVHPVVGAHYYAFTRANDLGVGASVAASVTTSLLWEVFVELHEKVSVNDILMTPSGGIAIGEFLFQLGEYVNSAPHPTGLHDVFAASLGMPRYLHNRLDGWESEGGPADQLGLSARWRHWFELAYLGSLRPFEPSEQTPRPAQGGIVYAEVESGVATRSAGQVHIGFIDGRIDRFAVSTWATFAGWPLGRDADIGIGVAFDYLLIQLPGQRDRLGLGHLPGLHVQSRNRLGPALLVSRLRLHPDLAAVESHAFRKWREDRPDLAVRSVLENHGYYFGLGGSAQAEARLTLQGFDAKAMLFGGVWHSVEGLDRFEEEVTAAAALDDTALHWEAGVGYSGALDPFRVAISLGGKQVWSRMGPVEVRRGETRLLGTVGLLF